jgi:hypothetical protein
MFIYSATGEYYSIENFTPTINKGPINMAYKLANNIYKRPTLENTQQQNSEPSITLPSETVESSPDLNSNYKFDSNKYVDDSNPNIISIL